MSGVAAFIENDSEGKPYMGLVFEEGVLQVRAFVTYQDNCVEKINEMCKMLKQVAHDLSQAESTTKLIVADGVIPDGFQRRSQGR